MARSALPAPEKSRESTRSLILDAAEELFSRENYGSVSLREVAQKADVFLGSVSYYFKTKEQLFEEMVGRRAEEMNAIRLARLRQYQNPSVEQVVEAFTRPLLDLSVNKNWRNYILATRTTFHEERWRHLNEKLFHRFMVEFFDRLQDAMPGLSREYLARGFMHVLAVLIDTLQLSYGTRVRILTRHEYSEDPETLYMTVLAFSVGGLRALAMAEFLAGATSGHGDQRSPPQLLA